MLAVPRTKLIFRSDVIVPSCFPWDGLGKRTVSTLTMWNMMVSSLLVISTVIADLLCPIVPMSFHLRERRLRLELGRNVPVGFNANRKHSFTRISTKAERSRKHLNSYANKNLIRHVQTCISPGNPFWSHLYYSPYLVQFIISSFVILLHGRQSHLWIMMDLPFLCLAKMPINDTPMKMSFV